MFSSLLPFILVSLTSYHFYFAVPLPGNYRHQITMGDSKSSEASGQARNYHEREMKRIIAEVTEMDITDDDLWYTLRVMMEGWCEEDIRRSSITTQLRKTMMKRGVFVERPPPGTTIASMVLKAIDGDYMPEWTKQMATTVARYRPIRTMDPDLQAFLGRENVEPQFWHESRATTQASAVPSSTSEPAPPVSTVSDIDPSVTSTEPLFSAYSHTNTDQSHTVRLTPSTNTPSSYRSVKQYEGQYEGEEDEEENDDKGWSDGEECEAVSFWSTVGTMTLADQRVDPVTADKVAPSTNSSPYGDDKFLGIAIVTSAAYHSSAGVAQFRALQRLRPDILLDESTRGDVKIRFGLGSSVSIGSAKIRTAIGDVVFHVIPATTPFILSLADMNRLDAYFDNIRNVVVSNDIIAPAVRRYGHAYIAVAGVPLVGDL